MARHEALHLRFWRRVTKTEGCWLWAGTTSTDGYGMVRVQSPKRTNIGAHRVAWLLTYGPIPDGRQVLHRCDNPPCVNPDHLFIGTNDDNMADKAAKGRSADVRGARNPKAKLTPEQVADIRARWRPGKIGRPVGGPSLTARLAVEYGVTKSTIYHVARHWNWTE